MWRDAEEKTVDWTLMLTLVSIFSFKSRPVFLQLLSTKILICHNAFKLNPYLNAQILLFNLMLKLQYCCLDTTAASMAVI